MKKSILFLVFGLLAFSACKKDKEDTLPTTTQNSVTIQLSHAVDGLNFYYDSLLYTNAAGNHYEVTRLWYYLSRVCLIRADSSLLLLKEYQFVDGAVPSTHSMKINDVAEGTYIGISYQIGIDSVLNQTDSLPATTENQNMAWPDPMGGGYHFLKLEGRFQDSTAMPGFAMHIGTNAFLVHGKIYTPVTIGSGDKTLNMQMNLNEWFRNPDIYDFNVDGNYSMSSMMAMDKLMRNGADVFTLQ